MADIETLPARLRELKLTQVLNHTAVDWIEEAASSLSSYRGRVAELEGTLRAVRERLSDYAPEFWETTIEEIDSALSHQEKGE